MEVLVQKFGGTSVSTKDRRKNVIKNIKEAIKEGFSPVVVVSAMGRKGEPYATDTLLSLIDENFKNNNKNSKDLLMCCGEIISAVVLCNELYNEGIKAIPLTGGQAGIITNESFGEAESINTDSHRLISILREGTVPVVTGFQGVTKEGYFTTLGRGGSDTTACILGAAVKAEEIDIFTDVDGIMTADPRIVEDASLINEITYNEVFQLADQGAKVIHPRAVDLAKKGKIPLKIKNTMNECEGTLISDNMEDKNIRYITGITYLNNRVQIRIRLSENENVVAYRSLLNILAKSKISLDLINIFPAHQIFTVDKKEEESVCSILDLIGINYSVIENCTTIAIVGAGMRGVPGIMARIINVLQQENIEVLQTTDSNMTIWCLIYSKDKDKAINLLHEEFNLSLVH